MRRTSVSVVVMVASAAILWRAAAVGNPARRWKWH
jgi:hypothetical protein